MDPGTKAEPNADRGRGNPRTIKERNPHRRRTGTTPETPDRMPAPPITPAGPGRQDALNAARRAVPDAVAAITGTDESIANSIEALSLPLRGF